MKRQAITICCMTALALLAASCAGSAGYSPPPARRASEQCPMGETWICRDQYPSRLGSEDPKICYCESLHRVR
jgi:hypothetical protein